ncbi:MAG: DUF2723 domain-containing protein [Caldilineaceae bacterium]|nr:DUF2723 domain-containing protein [Caldilineaceae bacterium]
MDTTPSQSTTHRRSIRLAAAGAGVAAFGLYAASLAPGLTWAHQGADGGELLAAAAANGVPHPPGYPLYIMLLQLWLGATGLVAPGSDLALRGNWLSALFGAASVAVTVLVAGHLLRQETRAWVWALLAGLAWATAPLPWSQSIITEVYSLHALLIALLAWAVLVKPLRVWYVVPPVVLGIAHHLTIVLLLPAALYALFVVRTGPRRWLQPALALGLGVTIGALLYARIPLVAASGPPPVNWGYADNLAGFWWLVSGAAYRGYLLSGSTGAALGRVTAWASTVTSQFTPVGLALGFAGLAVWDRVAPHLRTFSIIWVTPVSIYAILYYTRDSDIYLLPVAWIVSVWMAVGAAALVGWLQPRLASLPVLPIAASIAGVGLLLVVVLRWPSIALRSDVEARQYLSAVGDALEPDSILITLADRETFAAWYGAWAGGSLRTAAPGMIPVNESLYQFDWYRRLQHDLYPNVPAIDESAQAVVDANLGARPIFFAEKPAWLDPDRLEAAGPLWRVKP